METEASEFDEVPHDSIHIEAIECYHVGDSKFSASYALNDQDEENFRSYLLNVDLKDKITFDVQLQFESTLMSHFSYSEKEHEVIRLGGRLLHARGNEVMEERLPEGVLRTLWSLDASTVFAFGDRGSYMRENGAWSEIPCDQSWYLTGMGGNSKNNIYASGNLGLLLKLNGHSWEKIPLETEEDFKAIYVAKDGSVYLAGADSGYVYANSTLTKLECEPLNYFSICEFQGKVYWSSVDFGVSVQNGNKLEKFKSLKYGFRLHASAEFLAVTGWKDMVVFDGKKWDGFSFAYEGKPVISRYIVE